MAGAPLNKMRQIEGKLIFYGPVSHCSPKVKSLLQAFHEKFQARMSTKFILDAANKRYTDLPRIPKYTEGSQNRLCYTWVFGHCPYGVTNASSNTRLRASCLTTSLFSAMR